MSGRLKGRNALVTGAGRGIGRAVSLALAEEGANVVVCDLGVATDGTGVNKSPADEVVNECKKLGVKAVANYGDVADFKAAEGMIKSCVDNFGSIDILCNIAGIDKPQMLVDISGEDFDRMIAVHLKGTFNLTRHAGPLMIAQRYGRIINCVSELYAKSVGFSSYAAAKGGIASLTYATAHEMGRHGITCNAFIPRATTRMFENESVMVIVTKIIEEGYFRAEEFEETASEMADPSSFAPFITYLASDAAANINGCLFLTSGFTLGIWNNPEVVRKVSRDFAKEGGWTFDNVEKLVPEKLLVDYVNPAPPLPPEKK